jgi:hypothetical protein
MEGGGDVAAARSSFLIWDKRDVYQLSSSLSIDGHFLSSSAKQTKTNASNPGAT